MPRRLYVKLRPIAEKLRSSWYFRVLGPRITDTRLWGVNRRAITTAFGAGIAIWFIPLPAHLVISLVAAIIWRLNVPTVVLTSLLLNPLTVVPVYYFAYRVGALLLSYSPGPFRFELSWDWLQTGLGALWKPFLLGCLVCAVVGGYLGTRLLDLLWRANLRSRWRARRDAKQANRHAG
jgi:uncharacterized protein (DUF2062 family)